MGSARHGRRNFSAPSVFSFFSKPRSFPKPLAADMHSHLIPGIDDGVRTPEEAFSVIDQLIALGYSKLITTPHIMSDYFGNTTQSVRAAFESFLPVLREKGYTISFEAAAEYYLDDHLISTLANKDPLLTFGDHYLLFETNMISEPLQLKDFIFNASLQGYKVVMAHPERYQYMTLETAEDLRNRGVLLQINMLSLIGQYGPPVQRMAEKLISRGWIDLLGTDCHNLEHAQQLRAVHRTTAFRKALDLPLINQYL
jgi:tyrosine-protein phosphatase YwqE